MSRVYLLPEPDSMAHSSSLSTTMADATCQGSKMDDIREGR